LGLSVGGERGVPCGGTGDGTRKKDGIGSPRKKHVYPGQQSLFRMVRFWVWGGVCVFFVEDPTCASTIDDVELIM